MHHLDSTLNSREILSWRVISGGCGRMLLAAGLHIVPELRPINLILVSGVRLKVSTHSGEPVWPTLLQAFSLTDGG